MSKFFYIFLLNLLLLSEIHHFDAHLLDPRTLDKIQFETGYSELNEIENPPEFQRRQTNDADSLERKKRSNGNVRFDYHGAEGLPHYFFERNIQGGSTGPEEAGLSKDKCPSYTADEWSARDGNRYRAMRKWRELQEKTKRKKRVPLEGLDPSHADRAARYLDYTNSQMPFNEGKMRKNFQTSNSKTSGDVFNNGNLYFDYDNYLNSEIQPKRLGRSMRRHLDLPLEFQESFFETEDPLSEYSRVRRYLDQERAKQRIRLSNTLEAKEAAMSRVLDPNLNSDGILEPHVRKRRGMHSKKRDLSFSTRHRRRRRTKRMMSYVDDA